MHAPIYQLDAFGEKADWTDFYIHDLASHVREHAFTEKPHKHDFYLAMYVSKGKGIHIVDFVEYDVLPGSVFLMTPGQVHTWRLSSDIKGFVMFFTRDFYQMQLSENSLLEFPFFHSLDASPCIHIQRESVVQFVLNQMQSEFANTSKTNLRLIRAYLDVFLLEVAKYCDPSNENKISVTSKKLRRLEQLIDENFISLKQAGDYADLMNLGTGHLNSICKEALGKTLTDLIHQRILLEAKRLFAYSDFNVNEIAAKLGYADPSYFVRWFKNRCGYTPDEFRKRLVK